MESKNYFQSLNEINVNDKTEKKGNLTYLSWAWAWGEVKKRYPDTQYKVYENADGFCYFTDGKTAWVKVGVTVNGLEHIEYLPIMNNTNRSIPLASITSYDVNKSIQRCLTKAIARHGLGLYIYAGEDLPEDAETPAPTDKPKIDISGEKLDKTISKSSGKQTTETADLQAVKTEESAKTSVQRQCEDMIKALINTKKATWSEIRPILENEYGVSQPAFLPDDLAKEFLERLKKWGQEQK